MGKRLGLDKRPLLGLEAWCDTKAAWDAVNTGKPYPVRALFAQAGNALHQDNCTYVWETMKKIDFFLDIDLWHTPTNEMADIKLPAQHWLEVNSPRKNQGASGAMGATVQCIKPLSDTKSDNEICELMYKEWGQPYHPDPKNPWPGEEAHLNAQVAGMGLTWKEYVDKFQRDGWWDLKKVNPDDWGTYRRYEMGVLRPGTVTLMSHPVDSSRPYTPADQIKRVPGFGTPTGKQEIWSTIIETLHPGENQELPQFVEPPLSPVRRPDLYKNYPLMLITGRRIPMYFHSEHRQLPWLRELWPVPKLEIHPETAEKYNIAQGDWVWVESPHGKIRLWADIYLGISPEVISSDHRWWFPEAPAPKRGFHYSEVNVLVDHDAQDPLIATYQVRGYPVKIYKAKEGAPEGIITSSDDPRLKKWLPDYTGRT